MARWLGEAGIGYRCSAELAGRLGHARPVLREDGVLVCPPDAAGKA